MATSEKFDDRTCVLCGGPNEPWNVKAVGIGPAFEDRPHGYGNNPEPLKPFSEGRCCNTCNDDKVLPARLADLHRRTVNAHLN